MTKQTVPIEAPENRPPDGMVRDRHLDNRSDFLLFIKILFRVLKQARDVYRLEKAKTIVRRTRLVPATQAIRCGILDDLKELVGPILWSKACRYMKFYRSRKGGKEGVSRSRQQRRRNQMLQDTLLEIHRFNVVFQPIITQEQPNMD